MKLIENILLKGCGYSVLILAAFYAFGMPHTVFAHFLIITLFGMVISVSDLIFKAKKLPLAFRFLIHYAILFTAFYLIFIVLGNQINSSSGNIFVSIVIFTVFYAVMSAIIYILRKLIRKTDKIIDSKNNKNLSDNSPKNQYKPLYK